MLKRILLLSFAVFSIAIAKAQTTEEVYNRYLDFNLARLGPKDEAIDMGAKLAADAAELPEKARNNFYYSLGKLYEDDSQSVKAVEYYEKLAAAVPNYYVVHRALGYLYAKQAEDLTDKLNTSASNPAENKRIMTLYIAKIKQALPHLEKAQACDPDEDTLTRIKLFYKNIKDNQGAASLNNRLAVLSKNCIDLLEN